MTIHTSLRIAALTTCFLSSLSFSPLSAAQSPNTTAEHGPRALMHGLAERTRISGQPVQYQSLEQRQAHYHVPGVSVALLRQGQLAWTFQNGVRKVGSTLPVDPDTVFQAGSISKPAFAAVLMKYAENNPVDLDVDVNSLLRTWQLPQHNWSDTAVVSLRRLLSHTAGTTVHGFPGYAAGKAVPSLQQVLSGVSPANTAPVIVDIQPGTRMRYSGGGTTLAQLALQDMSDEHLTAMAKRLLFEPLGMSRSGFNQPITPDLSNNMATPYNADGTEVKGGPHTYATLAAAGLWSTPADLLKFAGAVRSAYFGTDTSWITQQTAIDMLTSNAPTSKSPDVGIGFFIHMSDTGEMLGFGHGGADEGYMSQLYVEIESGNGYAIMTNGNNGTQLIQEIEIRIAEAFGVGYAEPNIKTVVNISKPQLTDYIGTYKVNEPVNVDIILTHSENGFLLTAHPYVENEQHWYQGDDEFFAMDGTEIQFSRNEKGAITQLVTSNGITGQRSK